MRFTTLPSGPLAALAYRWPSEDLQWSAQRASQALRRRGVPDESVDAVMKEAIRLMRDRWPTYLNRPEQPDVIYADDEEEPYVAVRFPIPASAEEASELTWTLAGLLIERRLNLRGFSVGFFPARSGVTATRRA